MTESLDNILSGKGEALPEPVITPEPEPAPEQPGVTPEPEPQDSGEKRPPIGAIRNAEREKAAKRYTEQVADFEKKLEETNAAWERRMAQVLDAVKQPQQPQQAPDWFENPNAATMHAINPHLEAIQQQNLALAKELAETRFTPDRVNEAERAFIKAMQAQTLDPADYQKVVSSPNRYAAAVQWFAKRQVLEEVGDDPAAYKEKLKAELLAELKTGAPTAQPVMPSNLAGARNVGTRAGPAWAGPTALADIFKR